MTSATETPATPENGAKKIPRSPVTILIWAVLGITLGLFLAYFAVRLATGQPLIGPPRFNGIVMQSPQPMPNFTLTAHTGEEVSLYDYRDKVVLLYFGYTFCPDVCPATMWELSEAIGSLSPKQQEQVQVLMISVDPERDTTEKLADYVAHFNPEFVGMTGTEDEVLSATTPFGIYYEKHDGSAESGYLIDHTASVTVLDKDGYMRLIYPFNTPAADISADLEHLVRQ